MAHECVSGLVRNYAETAAKTSDEGLRTFLHMFETPWKGDTPGGPYQTAQWRIYKRIFRQEAQRRGLGT